MKSQHKDINMFPFFFFKYLLDLGSFVVYDLGLYLKIFKLKKRSYGCCILSNCEKFKFKNFYGPNMNFMRSIFVGIVNCPYKEVAVEND